MPKTDPSPKITKEIVSDVDFVLQFFSVDQCNLMTDAIKDKNLLRMVNTIDEAVLLDMCVKTGWWICS